MGSSNRDKCALIGGMSATKNSSHQ